MGLKSLFVYILVSFHSLFVCMLCCDSFICPCLEYCSHFWGSSPYTSLLNRVESKAMRLIVDPSLTSTFDPLSLSSKVASLYLFYCYYFGHCSVFHLQWLGHVSHGRHHLPTNVLNSSM